MPKRTSSPPPARVEPSLPTLVQQPPKGPQWVHEIKWDGYRLAVHINGKDIRAITRNGFDWTDRFPTIIEAAGKLRVKSAILDGEACVLNEQGISDFGLMQAAIARGRKPSDKVVLYVFDLLFLDGQDLRSQTLASRRLYLVELLERTAHPGLVLSEEIPGSGEAVFRHACQLGLEGIISKRKDLPYVSGRTAAWLKTKCVLRDDFVVIGYEPGIAGSVNKLRVARRDEDGVLHYAGGVGSGLSERLSKGLKARLEKIAIAKPVIKGLRQKGIIWTEPKVVVEVEYRGLTTADQKLRHPAFKGVREDK
ncbi:bifunctional non-homologous end joining protein LigD [Rhodoligotrophos appendicifer]|uniref:non-homologous end-joining DNA ligase n=1 Tax=Rhodoligotrophos appendicifer TaxID=987056 RepID=UPI001184E82C|nr:non-homologous end-joining DNA ligase [Rhodoligotrophos appendicifer]